MTVLDNLRAGAHTVGSAALREESLKEVFELFPRVLERRQQLAGSLSGGEQQMVAIGRALMARPKLLLLDEPSLGIAPMVVAEIADAIRRLNQRGMSVLLVEQNARLALRLAGNAYALELGEVVVSGKGDQLLDDPFVRRAYLGV
jgi:branched-chain amino acid transport system ATP-binding protein